MKFNDFVKESQGEDPEEMDDVESVPPEESEMDDDDMDDMEDSDIDEDDMDDDEDSDEDDEVSGKIAELLPQVLSSTFKALEEVTIPFDQFAGETGLTKEDLAYWSEHASEVYPELTHSIELQGENVVIKEIGVDVDEVDVDEIEGDEDSDDDSDEDSDEDEEDGYEGGVDYDT